MIIEQIRSNESAWSAPAGAKRAVLAFAAAMLLATAGCAGRSTPPAMQAQVVPAAAPGEPDHIGIEDVVNVIGFGDLHADRSGRLVFRGQELVLITDNATATIPLKAIRSFTIERSTTALMRGTAGKAMGFIPRGVGNLYHAIRRGAEVLTLYYVDEHDALHGAVLLLPQRHNDAVIKEFAQAGLSPLVTPIVDPAALVANPSPPVETVAKGPGRPSVRIALPEARGVTIPAAYSAAAYEYLNKELTRGNLFEDVWRQGDRRAPADALALSVYVKQFRKGNAGRRGAIPVAGMLLGKTLIKADLRLMDASGGVLLHKEVKGSKRTSGESIAAARSLAQRVNTSIREVSGFASATAVASGQ